MYKEWKENRIEKKALKAYIHCLASADPAVEHTSPAAS